MELHWSLIIFTFFMCAAAGVFFIQSFFTFKRGGKKMQNLSIVTTLVLLIIGGLGVFTHLQHWERIFNGFGHITSGITWELILIILFAIVIVLFFLFKGRSEDGQAPKWCAILGMVVSAALVIVMSTSYLMASRPVWDSFLLILYYLANALFMGGLIAVFVSAACGEKACTNVAARFAFLGGIVQLIVLVCYIIYMQIAGGSFVDVGYYFDPTLPDIAMTHASDEMLSPIVGSAAPLFWIGVVIIGLAVPLAVMLRNREEGESIKDMFAIAKFDVAEAEGAAEAGAEDTEAEGVKGFLQLRASTLTGNQKLTYVIALVACAAGGVCWRVVLYMTAISAFPIFSIG